MKISIIIPVYNAGKYLEAAVSSALKQAEVEEIILVEDGSRDNSLDICEKLKGEYKKIKLFQHLNGENRGAGESRNLGLKNATQEYVAFLDADDFYLENRFETTKKVFANPDVDGVYEAIGVSFENEKLAQDWSKKSGQKLTTVSEKVDPDKLFLFLALAGKGHFSLDGLTLRSRAMDNRIFFFNDLEISEDTGFCLKLSLLRNLYPGSIDKEVAMRRVHDKNRITRAEKKEMIYYGNILWNDLFEWSKDKRVNFSKKALIYFMKNFSSILNTLSKNNFKINQKLLFVLIFPVFLLIHPFMGLSVLINIIQCVFLKKCYYNHNYSI